MIISTKFVSYDFFFKITVFFYLPIHNEAFLKKKLFSILL